MILHLSAIIISLVSWVSVAFAASSLENPAPGALKSGVGVVSGWVCEADKLEVSFDGGARKFVPYGSERVDTAGVCGDTDNGFGLLWNYNELGDGPHTVTLYIDGMVATQVNFNVVTLGTNFLRGVTGHGTITLSNGKQVDVQWEETTQGFTITGYRADREGVATDAEAALEKLLGTWEVTVPIFGSPQTDIYTFDRIFVSATGVTQIAGTVDFSEERPGVDKATKTGLTRDVLTDPSSSLIQYTYVMYHEGRGTCFAEFFNLTSPTTFTGVSYGGYLFDGQEECEYHDEPPTQMDGRRIDN